MTGLIQSFGQQGVDIPSILIIVWRIKHVYTKRIQNPEHQA